jgi:hypothetical protein
MKSFNRALMGVASAMTLAAAAYAQPTPNADAGTIAPCNIATGTLTGFVAGQVQWVRFTIDAVNRTAGDFLDIDTNGGTLTGSDSHIGLYNSVGARVAIDDDDGPSAYSMLSFGATSPTRPGVAPTGNATSAGNSHAGADGATLAAGTYWLAVSGYSATFSTTVPWGVTTAHARTGDVVYRIHHGRSVCPTNPTGVGSWATTSVSNCGTASSLARVTVTPGTNPASTGIRVTADMSSVGGSSSQRLYDNGTNGDVTAGDNIFSFLQTVAAGTTAGGRAFTFNISDSETRSSSGTSANLTVTACPTGACCLATGCETLQQPACVAAGGVYRGDNVPCTPLALVGGASAFEDISSVGTLVTLGDDTSSVVSVGFSFPFYGNSYSDVNMVSNGFLIFGTTSTSLTNGTIPSTGVPNNAIYGLWDDLNPGAAGQCYTATLGTAGTDLRFIAQWTNVPQYNVTDSNTFQIVIFETGAVEVRYGQISTFAAGDITVGVENSTGTVGVSIPDSSITSDSSFRFGLTQTCVSDPTGVGSLAAAVQNCGDRNALVRVTVTPGLFPASTGLMVVADASSIGGSATLALNDAGTDGDVTAGDNIFSANVLVSHTIAAGPASISFAISDAQGRTGSGSFAGTISACTALGACCLPTGCESTSIGACVAGGGSFQGVGTPCIVPPGYVTSGTAGAFEDISSVGTVLAQGDDTTFNVPIGFDFTFYGTASYSTINVCSNGFASFTSTSTAFTNAAIPSAAAPNDGIYPLWDDFNFSGGAGACYHATLGTAGVDRRFVAQWTNVPQYSQTDTNTFPMVLFESGEIEFRYGTVAADFTVGGDAGGATVGVENGDGTVATSVPGSSITSNSGIRLVTTEGGPVCSSCPPCAADYNNDGGVDGGDIEAFFPAWEASDGCADVNLDGGIDGGDIEFFFSVWETGGC